MPVFLKSHFYNERAAFKYLEDILWPNGPRCPHCGVVNHAYKLKGRSTRVGVHKCGSCRKQFRVTVGTVFEHLRMPLNKALQAVYLVTSPKKAISVHQLHRTLEITYKSAWFLSHRVRDAAREGKIAGVDEANACRNAKKGARGPPIPEKKHLNSLLERCGADRVPIGDPVPELESGPPSDKR